MILYHLNNYVLITLYRLCYAEARGRLGDA